MTCHPTHDARVPPPSVRYVTLYVPLGFQRRVMPRFAGTGCRTTTSPTTYRESISKSSAARRSPYPPGAARLRLTRVGAFPLWFTGSLVNRGE